MSDSGRNPDGMLVLAIDPGREKCGLAVVSAGSGVLHREVCPTSEVANRVSALRAAHTTDACLLGNATASREVRRSLEAIGVPITLVPETNTTLRAVQRYFREHPPRGWRRWIPLGLQVPPVLVDDYAAVIMAEDYLAAAGEQKARDGQPTERTVGCERTG